MHLRTKELLLFIFPFLASFVLYFFGQEVVGTLHTLFPSYERYTNSEIDVKMEKYLSIEAKHQLYEEIEKKKERRKSEQEWVAEHILYRDAPLEAVVEELAPETLAPQVEEKERTYTLQALFPEDKTVIINDLILKEGAEIEGAKIVQVSDDGVLIETNKGLKWLYMFK